MFGFIKKKKKTMYADITSNSKEQPQTKKSANHKLNIPFK